MSARRAIASCAVLCALAAVPAAADDPGDPPERRTRILDIEITPTSRAQLAVWIERADGTFLDTLALTQATATRGIGNRPGATQMNSGFRWPYGRREGVLPVWAHRRAAAPGAELFPRVIFQDRSSEGFASRTSNDFSRDDYFCLSFMAATTTREALDAVSCASVFNSDKGRYLAPEDVSGGYGEPVENGATSGMRPLALGSVYPPRRDVARCATMGCYDHPDVARFSDDARRVMPSIDAVTMATPAGDQLRRITFDVPEAWEDGDYIAFIEVNVEGDYNETYNDVTYPTPSTPSGRWDYWAESYGYPYRGQPSVVYAVPFSLRGGGGDWSVDRPTGIGAMDGATGTMLPMGPGITDDPAVAPGSGADRLHAMEDGSRVRVSVVATNVCSVADPPPECGVGCSAERPCAEGFVCAPDATCVGMCDLDMPPLAVGDLELLVHPDEKHSHHWGVLRFVVPESDRPIERYEVRVGTEPILDEESFMRAQPAFAADIDSVGLVVPTDGAAGDQVEVELGGLSPLSTHHVGIRPVDRCNDDGPILSAELTTTEIHFTTVTPCFVATAAYGTPLASEIAVLRRFRDRHLATHAAGRALVDAYYAVGPGLADVIRTDESLRGVARTVLAPIVAFVSWRQDDPSP